MLAAWLDAEAAVASGQEYSISTATGSRSLKRVDADMITKKIAYWQIEVNRLSSKRKGANSMHSVAKFK